MSWMESLVRIADHQIETLRKRVAEIGERRAACELALAVLDAEAELEDAHAQAFAEAGLYMIGFREGWKARRAARAAELATIELEEQGARDALVLAYEELKKVEHVAEASRLAQLKETARRDSAALDELALRRRAAAR